MFQANQKHPSHHTAVAMASAPTYCAYWMATSPTPPAAAWIKQRSPRFNWAKSPSAWKAFGIWWWSLRTVFLLDGELRIILKYGKHIGWNDLSHVKKHVNHFVAGMGCCKSLSWMDLVVLGILMPWMAISNYWHWFMIPSNALKRPFPAIPRAHWRHAWIPTQPWRPPQLWRKSRACSKPGQNGFLACRTLTWCHGFEGSQFLAQHLKIHHLFQWPTRKQLIQQDGFKIVTNNMILRIWEFPCHMEIIHTSQTTTSSLA